MSTSAVLSNGKMLVNIDHNLRMVDLYFPHIGEENQLSLYANPIFVWINGIFLPLDHQEWDISTKYIPDTLVAESTASCRKFKVEIKFVDFVYVHERIFVRKFQINNNSDTELNIKVFFQNNFDLFENDIADTAMWYAPNNSMVHYKKRRYIAIASTQEFYQNCCAGRSDTGGKGAYPDEFSGELYFNPIATGSVNSCVSFQFVIQASNSTTADIFYAAGFELSEVENLVKFARLPDSIDRMYKLTKEDSGHWLSALPAISNLNTKQVDLYKKSLLIIRSHLDHGGAVVASTDGRAIAAGAKDSYAYFWPRDGAMVMDTLVECGVQVEVERYFEYMSKLIHKDGFFLHKYHPGAEHGPVLGSSWHAWINEQGEQILPIQEDETALNLILFEKYHRRFGNLEVLAKYWSNTIYPMSEFLCNFRDLNQPELPSPSYDIWEVSRLTTAYTTATVYRALKSAEYIAAHMAEPELASKYKSIAEIMKNSFDSHFYDQNLGRYKNSDGGDIDASLALLYRYDICNVDSPLMKTTIDAIIDKLEIKTKIGGIVRREQDLYMRLDENTPGNSWFITTLWMAQYYFAVGDNSSGQKYLDWATDHADSSGLMSEQADPNTGYGHSVKPLVWSHAEYVKTVNML